MRLVSCFLLVLPFTIFGQGFFDIGRVDFTRGLAGNYERLSNLAATIQVPILLNSGDAILTGFSLEGVGVEDVFSEYQGRNLTFTLGANIILKEDRPLTIATVHRMNSDAFSIDGDAYQIGIAALYTYKKTEQAELRLGFYGNTEFMGPIVTPLFGVDWKITPNIRFYGVLPATGTLAFKQSDNWSIGGDFLGVFQTYRQPTDGAFYLQRSMNLMSLFSDYYLTKNIVLSTKVGLLVGSGYKLFEEGDQVDWALNLFKFGDDRTELNRISTDGIVFKVGIVYRYSLENN